jgi:hypothetical protein
MLYFQTAFILMALMKIIILTTPPLLAEPSQVITLCVIITKFHVCPINHLFNLCQCYTIPF